MSSFVDILDSFILAFQIVARSVAFLLGIHLFIFLYFVRLLSSEPAESPRRRRARFTVPARRRQTITTRGRVFATHPRLVSPARHLHLPALDPRPYDEPLERSSAGIYKHLISHIIVLGHKIIDEMLELADRVETRGGKSGELVTMIRKRGEIEVKAELLRKLPSEITSHILMIAADMIPTRICLLSKTHHRLVIPRLYKTVQLSDPRIFRRFRMTMALHNPDLGQHVQSLSVGSCTFDNYGYFPDAIAESAALGVGLEQILITAFNLKHLYLDLFSLAALHDGTASRIQHGALPVSLSTEYAAPQYLSLPVFSKLQHVELSVFGMDKMAVEYLRQALPHVKSLTLRWVTRQSPGFAEADIPPNDGASDENSSEIGASTDDEDVWSRGSSYQRNDFVSFVEALETLRSNHPDTAASSEEPRQPLEAITVLAWPKVLRQLLKYYREDRDVIALDTKQVKLLYKDTAWDKSLGQQDDYSTRPRFDRLTTRRPTAAQASSALEAVIAPLRLAVDPMYKLGPRRGPLESWSEQYG